MGKTLQGIIEYFKGAEEREQGYIVEITKLRMENKDLKKRT